MTWFQVLTLCGVPSILVAIVTGLVARLHKHVESNDQTTSAIKNGVQALLRAQLISDYNKWSAKGYAPIYARENFDNCYKQYHALGENGVMDDIYKKFMALPTPQDGGN